MIEANQIIGREAFKVLFEAKALSKTDLATTAQDFLNGPDYNKPRGRGR